MKTTLAIKYTVLYTLLLLLPTSLWAAEQIRIKTKFIESSKQVIPHDIAKAAQMKGMDLMTAPSIVSKSGEEAKIEIIRDHQPASVAPSIFKSIPVGVIIQVTPHFKEGEIAYTARFTISQVITNEAPKGQTRSEVSTRDLFVSGISKDGEKVWFDFIDPNSKKKIAVMMTFTTKK